MQNIAQRPGKKQNETDRKVHKLDSHLTKELHIRVQTRILFCRRKAAAHSQLTNKNSHIYLHTINQPSLLSLIFDNLRICYSEGVDFVAIIRINNNPMVAS